MLWQRVVTAVVLLLVLLPALFYPSPVPFSLVAMAFIAAGAWEWARLTGYGPVPALATGVLAAAACAVAWFGGLLDQPLPALWVVAAVLWVVGRCLVVARWPGGAAQPAAVRATGAGSCCCACRRGWPWRRPVLPASISCCR